MSTCVCDGEWSVDALLRRVVAHRPPLVALIDAGALLVNESNERVARLLVRLGVGARGSCGGVVFFDDASREMVLLADGSGDIVPLALAGLPPSRRFTLYDQPHTTGSNVAQPLGGAAALLVGKDLTLRDYAQACWRMRALGRDQTVHALVVDQVAQLVGSSAHAEIMPTTLLVWLTANGSCACNDCSVRS
jgi:hypothetical protein